MREWMAVCKVKRQLFTPHPSLEAAVVLLNCIPLAIDVLLMPLFQYHSTSSPTEALSSLLDPFAASPTADPSLNITHLTGVPYRQMNGVAVNHR